jgi:ATP-dependent DNA helicase RecQ
MDTLAFVDVEACKNSHTCTHIGALRGNQSFQSHSLPALSTFLRGAEFVCGHNFIQHDLKYLQDALEQASIRSENYIDSLLLAPLLFPERIYFRLQKNYREESTDANKPEQDSREAQSLFVQECQAFQKLNPDLQAIYYALLKHTPGFQGFFRYLKFEQESNNLTQAIQQYFQSRICEQTALDTIIAQHPTELAYALALIEQGMAYSRTPPWLEHNYVQVDRILHLLRGHPCTQRCGYCAESFNARSGLAHWFGFSDFRTFGKIKQETVVQAGLNGDSLLAIFPTGGGKSLTFQLPAFMAGQATRGLTVVISPLQSLMKDQVDNLRENCKTQAVTINGSLEPLERKEAIKKVEDGSASLLYLSPESLRSSSITRLLKTRKIERFVIDEAHCLSTWGQDFRVDYLYIARFIQKLQETSLQGRAIPVSCFTATARPKVVEDILTYFRDKLGLELTCFQANTQRTNLHYEVLRKGDEDDKFQTLLNLLGESPKPSIVYVSRTKSADQLAEKLQKVGIEARAYHGKMDNDVKKRNQEEFKDNIVSVMVATTAFGMGVDKDNVERVIHYDISNSLENYVQEAGRGARDKDMKADCTVLFNEEDLNKHFQLLTQSRLSKKDIQDVWKAIKELTDKRKTMAASAQEIAQEANWDKDAKDLETKVKAAINALEDAEYLIRHENIVRVFADSLNKRNAQSAIEAVQQSIHFDDSNRTDAIRIVKSLIARSHRITQTEGVAIDQLADELGLERKQVMDIISLLRAEKIIGDRQDLAASFEPGKLKFAVEKFGKLAHFLAATLVETPQGKVWNLKELNEKAKVQHSKPSELKELITLWSEYKWVEHKQYHSSGHHVSVQPMPNLLLELETFQNQMLQLSETLTRMHASSDEQVHFSVVQLYEELVKSEGLFQTQTQWTHQQVEQVLLYLKRIRALKIDGGFLVFHNRLKVERLKMNNRKQFTGDDYQKLLQHYKIKIEQIHIVGEYARKMIENQEAALQFVDDYFQLPYEAFLNKYFDRARRQEMCRSITPEKFKKLFGQLSTEQLAIVNDPALRIRVLAGPGSGKTRTLVHKLASMLLVEDVRYNQLLMLTFSRAAASEFKERLVKLVDKMGYFIDIKTFHSFAFDLLGRMGTLESSKDVLKEAAQAIRSGDVELSYLNRSVLVLDEAQDISEKEYELVQALIDANQADIRVLAVGDDDQNIYEFRQSDSQYMRRLSEGEKSSTHELLTNYRSKANLVEFTNQFVLRLANRQKKHPIQPANKQPGTLRLVRYQGEHLLQPFIEDVLQHSKPEESTGVLTHTNEEAALALALLREAGRPARLIQDQERFDLTKLQELRSILEYLYHIDKPVFDDEVWQEARRRFITNFSNSPHFKACDRLLEIYEGQRPKGQQQHYLHDFLNLVRESSLEDFVRVEADMVLVSTIHKAKGREFDQVFMLLSGNSKLSDNFARALYVGMTRAKSGLHMHTNTPHLNGLRAELLQEISGIAAAEPPRRQILQLIFEDIYLDDSVRRQAFIQELRSGDSLTLTEAGCTNARGEYVLRFSKGFKESKLSPLLSRGYRLQKAEVNYIVWWTKKDDAQYSGWVVLPEIWLDKIG